MSMTAVDASEWIVPPSLARKFNGSTDSFLGWWETLRELDDQLTATVADPKGALAAAYASQGTEWSVRRDTLTPLDDLERAVCTEMEGHARRLAAAGLTLDTVALFTGLEPVQALAVVARDTGNRGTDWKRLELYRLIERSPYGSTLDGWAGRVGVDQHTVSNLVGLWPVLRVASRHIPREWVDVTLEMYDRMMADCPGFGAVVLWDRVTEAVGVPPCGAWMPRTVQGIVSRHRGVTLYCSREDRNKGRTR